MVIGEAILKLFLTFYKTEGVSVLGDQGFSQGKEETDDYGPGKSKQQLHECGLGLQAPLWIHDV